MLFDRFAQRKPARLLFAPGGKIAHLGYTAVLAGEAQHLLECGLLADHSGRQVENAIERLVGEGDAAFGVELRHPDRNLVEQRALGVAEGAELARTPAACSSMSMA
jgi:hypothetical protein